jgi:hypothetical protein
LWRPEQDSGAIIWEARRLWAQIGWWCGAPGRMEDVVVSRRASAQPKGQESWLGRDPAGLEGWRSRWGVPQVVPCGAGAWPGLRGRGPRGRDPGGVWIRAQAGARLIPRILGSLRGMDPVVPWGV